MKVAVDGLGLNVRMANRASGGLWRMVGHLKGKYCYGGDGGDDAGAIAYSVGHPKGFGGGLVVLGKG